MLYVLDSLYLAILDRALCTGEMLLNMAAFTKHNRLDSDIYMTISSN